MSSAVAAAIRAKLAKAEEYLAMAELASDGYLDASVSLAVSAAINAADVLCLTAAGNYPSGQNHDRAPALLKKAGMSIESSQLTRVLGVKTKAQYSPARCTVTDATEAVKGAQRLLRSATREAKGYLDD